MEARITTEKIITAFISVVIGLALLPTVFSFVTDASANQTGAIAGLITLVPVFYVIGLVLVTIGVLVL